MSTSRSDAVVAADYYDGRSARVHRVELRLAGDRLAVSGGDVERIEPLAGLRVSEPMGATPRLVKFPDGAHCEVRDQAGFAALLGASGHRDGWVVHMQARWRWALLAIVLSVAAVLAGYRWGLPAASTWLAYELPERLVNQVGGSTLTLLDRSLFAPSKLPAARRQALVAEFAALATPDGRRPAYHIVYRDGGRVGANAFTLPDGTIVVTDQLVTLAGNDQEVLAVLAHELGHVEGRHSLRMLIQSSIVGLVVAWYMGDVSSFAAGLPTMLLEAGYSRDHEREADAYAANMLRRNGIPAARLGDMLVRLEAAHRDAVASDGSALDYLSSHPASRERIEALRGAAR
ncbi:M48 family metallopeptidase [Parasulfuritortus cantonensis]|uniref:M48 family metallopeptidase n=1 Tax=Parasulfuritortus cantonensis TaxID=2528202 RepID=A0A4R1BL84_9PROT|nr:M48 family metallopeptidase [Parasulfuritortus cantonensis]TCJ18018.1 M48 family metallopeptidase [Parasulfuritortus cantonensis]